MDLALSLTFTGIVIVFSVLIMLIVLIELLSFILRKISGLSVKKNEVVEEMRQKADPAITNINNSTLEEKASEQCNEVDDKELIAILTAAVAASMQRTSNSKIIVKSFRRIQQTSPVWNKSGRVEQIFGKL